MESIVSAAKRYKTLGFSVIPLNGARFPQRAKQPAIRWSRFQHVQPTDRELHDWFVEHGYVGIGVVCGRVSRLLVLDFDDAVEASEFRRHMPEFTDTYTVRSGTRGLPHFYYRLAADKLVVTQSFGKVDLRGEGSYVVVPPTRLDSTGWVVERDCEMRFLDDLDLRRLLGYLNGVDHKFECEVSEFRRVVGGEEYAGTNVRPGVEYVGQLADGNEPSGVLLGDLSHGVVAEVSEFRHLGSADVIRCYEAGLTNGRNRALFRAACAARDCGWLKPDVAVLLADKHACQVSKRVESYEMRYAEAIRTIDSAFSRSVRKFHEGMRSPVSNALREWLLGEGMAAAARVLDGLYLSGLKTGDTFSEREACVLLSRFGIGRRSIMAALQSVLVVANLSQSEATGWAKSPLFPPKEANAASPAFGLNNSCEMSRGAKRVKTGTVGRTPRLYRVPDASQLAASLGLKASGGDVLEPDDLMSPKSYRLALHRQLFKRRPGQYARTWLSARLGVTRWTTRRYEQAAEITCQPMYRAEVMNWQKAQARLPELAVVNGAFVEDENGKRYPALRGLALRLLASGRRLFYKRQEANYYAVQPPSVGIPTLQHRASPEDLRSAACSNTRLTPTVMSTEKASSVGIPTPHDPTPRQANHKAGEHAGTLAQVEMPTPAQPDNQFWLCPDCLNYHISEKPPASCKCGRAPAWELVPRSIWKDTERMKLWWRQRWNDHHRSQHAQYALPTEVDEPQLDSRIDACAKRLASRVTNLSRASARRLIHRYGIAAADRALRALGERANIHNPAGFVVSLLRSEHKFDIWDNSPISNFT